MLRRDLLRLRNAAGPLVEVCRRLTSADLPQIRPAMHPLFRDVTDHIRTVQEKIDALREVLAFAFEASVLMGQSQETAISKKLGVLGGHPRGADRDRRHLRHELRAHARVELDLRISDGRGRHSYRLLHPLLAVQKEWVALTWVFYARSILHFGCLARGHVRADWSSWPRQQMVEIRAFLFFAAARQCLRFAVATIRLMQCLYRHRFISGEATALFFATAKRMEHCADRLVAWERDRSRRP